MPIPVYDKFQAMTAAGVVANAENIAYDTNNGEIKQSVINDHLFKGERYDPSADSGKGAWVPNVADSSSVEVDGETITTNADGKLTVPIDGKTIKVEDSTLSVNVDGTTIQSDAESGVLSVGVASTDILGGIKVANVRTGEVDAESGGTGAIDRYYGVELDENGKAFVHVPWEVTITPIAGKNQLGSVKGDDDTGIVIDDNGVIKADFDTTDYSNIGDMTADDFPANKVASPDVVNKIVEAKLQVAIHDVLNTPM